MKGKLEDAIDDARLYSDSGSDSDDSDDEVPIASRLQQKKADARHKAKLGDRCMAPRGGGFDTLKEIEAFDWALQLCEIITHVEEVPGSRIVT